MALMSEQDEEKLAQIAQAEFGFETMATRNSDSLDFRDCAVWAAKSALQQAFELGRRAQAEGR